VAISGGWANITAVVSMPPNPRYCTHIRQGTGDWCVQACLESFLADNNLRKTQREMVELGIQNHLCDSKGIIPYDKAKIPEHRNLIEFCSKIGIDLEKIENRQIPQRIGAGEGVLIATWNYKNAGGCHCARFCEYTSDQKLRVMDPAPDPDEFPEWDKKYIDEWSCDVFKIRLKNPRKNPHQLPVLAP